MYLSCPILFAAFKRWPHIRRPCCLIGLSINAAAVVAASFAKEVSHLILSQGVLYAIGGVLLYCPTLAFVDEWFVHRKGLAFGVMWVRVPNSLALLLLSVLPDRQEQEYRELSSHSSCQAC